MKSDQSSNNNQNQNQDHNWDSNENISTVARSDILSGIEEGHSDELSDNVEEYNDIDSLIMAYFLQWWVQGKYSEDYEVINISTICLTRITRLETMACVP